MDSDGWVCDVSLQSEAFRMVSCRKLATSNRSVATHEFLGQQSSWTAPPTSPSHVSPELQIDTWDLSRAKHTLETMAPYERSVYGPGMSYPDPEQFAAPGPSWSTITNQYLMEHGVLPTDELMPGLLQKHWDDLGQSGVSQQPAEGVTDFRGHHAGDEATKADVSQNSTQYLYAARRSGALQFAQKRLDLVPFLGPSPAEVYGGPLFAPVPIATPRRAAVLEGSPSPAARQGQDDDGSSPVAQGPMNREYLPAYLPPRAALNSGSDLRLT